MSTILKILQHALGRDQYGVQQKNGGVDYRNHFVASEDGDTIGLCREAVAQGLATERKSSDLTGGDPVFFVTDKGKGYVATNSPKPPKLSAGQIRYQKWLDLDNGEKFGDYLKRKSRERKCTTPEAARG
jgi:hypothetical protein